MTKDEFARFLEEIIIPQLRAVREDGQKEYAHRDAFDNFRRLASQLKLDQKQILWVYLIKHLDGILSYINGHQSQREPVQGRCKDAIMYLCLLWGMLEEEEKMKVRPTLDPSDKDVLRMSEGKYPNAL